MAIDAGSGSKSKDSNGSNSKNKFVSKGSSSFDLGKTGVSTRSSVKATSSKQMDLRPAYKRKSERLEKRPPPMPSAKKKSGRLEQQNAPSHLRRSERFSTSSVSKHLGGESSSSSIKEEKREKIVKKLTMESESVSTRNKNYTTPVDLKRKKMDSRAYRLLFKKRKKENIASGKPIVLLKFSFYYSVFLRLSSFQGCTSFSLTTFKIWVSLLYYYN